MNIKITDERLQRPKSRPDKPELVKRILKIGREFAALPVLDSRKAEDMLYDNDGLPK